MFLWLLNYFSSNQQTTNNKQQPRANNQKCKEWTDSIAHNTVEKVCGSELECRHCLVLAHSIKIVTVA